MKSISTFFSCDWTENEVWDELAPCWATKSTDSAALFVIHHSEVYNANREHPSSRSSESRPDASFYLHRPS